MKEQFTGGDWKANDWSSYGDWGVESGKSSICCAFGAKNENEANAHLIAAAPKMYRMIDSLIKTLDDLYPSNARHVADEHMSEFVAVNALKKKAKELLAEARGDNNES